jgi:tetratricopeptide (TPR) repeat protein
MSLLGKAWQNLKKSALGIVVDPLLDGVQAHLAASTNIPPAVLSLAKQAVKAVINAAWSAVIDGTSPPDAKNIIKDAESAIDTFAEHGGKQAAATLERFNASHDATEIKTELLRLAEAEAAAGTAANKRAAKRYREIGALAFLNDPREAVTYYAKATELDPNDPYGWNNLGILQTRLGELDAAVTSYERVLALGNRATDQEVIATATSNLGIVYTTRGDLVQAEAMHKKALVFYEALGSKASMAANYGSLGNVYYTCGDLVRAEAMHREALALREALGSKEGMAASYSGLGLVYHTRGDLNQAEAMHREALALNEALGSKEGMAHDYSNLGNVYHTRGDLDQAEVMYKKAFALYEALGSKVGMANNYSNLGNVYATRGDLDQAEAMHREALALNEALGSKVGVAANYSNLGIVYAVRGDLDQAEAMHKKALDLHQALGSKRGMATNYGSLGLVCKLKGDMPEACKHWFQAHALWTQIGNPQKAEECDRWMREADCSQRSTWLPPAGQPRRDPS